MAKTYDELSEGEQYALKVKGANRAAKALLNSNVSDPMGLNEFEAVKYEKAAADRELSNQKWIEQERTRIREASKSAGKSGVVPYPG